MECKMQDAKARKPKRIKRRPHRKGNIRERKTGGEENRKAGREIGRQTYDRGREKREIRG
jgi:hypothetical protein